MSVLNPASPALPTNWFTEDSTFALNSDPQLNLYNV